MAIEFNTEEGCYEYNSEDDKSTVSIFDANEVAIFGHFNFEEIESIYLKMKELHGENNGN